MISLQPCHASSDHDKLLLSETNKCNHACVSSSGQLIRVKQPRLLGYELVILYGELLGFFLGVYCTMGTAHWDGDRWAWQIYMRLETTHNWLLQVYNHAVVLADECILWFIFEYKCTGVSSCEI